MLIQLLSGDFPRSRALTTIDHASRRLRASTSTPMAAQFSPTTSTRSPARTCNAANWRAADSEASFKAR